MKLRQYTLLLGLAIVLLVVLAVIERSVLSTPSPPAVVPDGQLEVHFVDVGQGDAILIRGPDGSAALVDGGEANTGIVEYLRAQGITHLDLIVATHPHSDHIGGLVDVLKAMPVEEVVTNGQLHTTRTFERFLDAIAESGARYREVTRGDVLALGELRLEVLNPTGPSSSNLNNGSIVLQFGHGDVVFLLMGDAEEPVERELIASSARALRSDILKVGHHGSRSSSSPEFLEIVRPEVAVYCAGENNGYGHPHAEVLQALHGVGAVVYGTDVNGTIVVISDGEGYDVLVEREGVPTPVLSRTPAR